MARNIVSAMLKEGLYTRAVGRRIVYFQRLSSTMDEAARLAKEGVEEGTVILAEEQTAGRGRFRRAWISQPGNLYLSIVLRPSPRGLGCLSMLSGVAVVRAIRKTTALKSTIKWPNDIKMRGKKVCGILVESVLEGDLVQHAIVGIGINVAFDPSSVDGLADIATGLNLETGKEIDRATLLRDLLQEMDRLYLPFRTDRKVSRSNASPQRVEEAGLEAVREEWRGLLETLGRQVEIRWQDEVYAGYAEDVDDAGNLKLRLRDGTLITLPAGEVTRQESIVGRGTGIA